MKRMFVIATVAWSVFVIGWSEDAGAARCRPARRNCVGVTHQPCAPATARAPQLLEAAKNDTTECICAVWEYANFGSYAGYYALDFYPDCSTYTITSIMGNFTTGSDCPNCPASSCLLITHQGSMPTNRRFKKGTRLDAKQKWDSKLVLNSGKGSFKAKGLDRTFEFEPKELTDAKMLVSFSSNNVQYFAKLHVVRVEAQEIGGARTSTVADFGVGQEIENPPASQKVRDVSGQVTILDPNVVEIKIGNTTYQIVTATPMSE